MAQLVREYYVERYITTSGSYVECIERTIHRYILFNRVKSCGILNKMRIYVHDGGSVPISSQNGTK